MQITRTTKIGIAAAAITAAFGMTVLAQGLGPSTGGSLAELTAEVRQLRMVIQDAGRNQTQMQALNISLTAQHSRLTQVSARMDAAQEELRKASEATQQITKSVAAAQEDLSNLAATASANFRAEAAERIKEYRAMVDRAVENETAARTRLNDLANAFRVEEQRWLQLVAQLEAILKR